MTVLTVSDLHIRYATGVYAVRGVSFSVSAGELVAVVGESGCGKSTLATSILGALPKDCQISGSLCLDGQQMVGASARTWRSVRGNQVGFVGQDPYGAMDPLWRVGSNVAEAWRIHRRGGADIPAALAAVGIQDPDRRARQYPSQWSGGMLQRASIAAAAALNPVLIVADEPTAALDVELAEVTVGRLRSAAEAVVLISHDLALVGRHADRVMVMYGGFIVEEGDGHQVLSAPRHPYTQGLLAAIPRPGCGLPSPLPGNPPDLSDNQVRCPFEPRCPLAVADCQTSVPALTHGLACPVVLT